MILLFSTEIDNSDHKNKIMQEIGFFSKIKEIKKMKIKFIHLKF